MSFIDFPVAPACMYLCFEYLFYHCIQNMFINFPCCVATHWYRYGTYWHLDNLFYLTNCLLLMRGSSLILYYSETHVGSNSIWIRLSETQGYPYSDPHEEFFWKPDPPQHRIFIEDKRALLKQKVEQFRNCPIFLFCTG
jgi:hypothetical protein